MGNLDYKNGRFDADFETNEIFGALRGWQSEFGDVIQYFRFWKEQSQTHPIWDEATGQGRVFYPPQMVPVMHANHIEGDSEGRAEGFYWNDDLYVTALYDDLTNTLGFNDLDLKTQIYLKDRIVYDYKVFRITRIEVTGQIQQRDIMVSIEGTEIRPDEMVYDPQFQEYQNLAFGGRWTS